MCKRAQRCGRYHNHAHQHGKHHDKPHCQQPDRSGTIAESHAQRAALTIFGKAGKPQQDGGNRPQQFNQLCDGCGTAQNWIGILLRAENHFVALVRFQPDSEADERLDTGGQYCQRGGRLDCPYAKVRCAMRIFFSLLNPARAFRLDEPEPIRCDTVRTVPG